MGEDWLFGATDKVNSELTGKHLFSSLAGLPVLANKRIPRKPLVRRPFPKVLSNRIDHR
jgi:hypothetical protein